MGRPGQRWSRVKSGRGKVDITFKKFEYKEKLTAGALRGESGEVNLREERRVL